MNKTQSQSPSAEPFFKIFTGALKSSTTASGKRRVRCTASSNIQDLHGDLITEECVQDMAIQAKSKAMNIFLNHSYDVPEDVFGHTADAQVALRDQFADMDLDILLNEPNPRAVATYDAIHGTDGTDGVTLGVSIGANIEEWEYLDEKKGFAGGLKIKKVNLLEASIVGIPANPRSWVQNGVIAIAKSAGMKESEAKELLAVSEEPKMVEAACPTCGHQASCDDGNCGCDNPFHSGAEIEPGDAIAEVAPEEAKAVEGEVITDTEEPLPDEAFASIDEEGGRHYPHHDHAGELDAELLRVALERAGDKSNVRAGIAHLMAHAKEAGIGEETEDGWEVPTGSEVLIVRDIEPAFAEHVIEDAEPNESCKCSEPVEVKAVESDLAPDGENQVPADEETTPVDLDTVKEVVEAPTSEISPDILETFTSALEELETLRRENEELKTKLADAEANFETAAELVDKISRLPLARKTQATEQINSFYAKYRGTYSEKWLKLIDDRNKED